MAVSGGQQPEPVGTPSESRVKYEAIQAVKTVNLSSERELKKEIKSVKDLLKHSCKQHAVTVNG
jgi:hypothetical protein